MRARAWRLLVGVALAFLVGAWIAIAHTLPDALLQALALVGFFAALATLGGVLLRLAFAGVSGAKSVV